MDPREPTLGVSEDGNMKKEKEEGVVKERPNFGDKQVRKLSEIEWGQEYKKHYGDGSSEIVIPVRRKDAYGMIKIRKIYDSVPFITDMSLADCGVIPYKETGLWNKTNWLEKIK